MVSLRKPRSSSGNRTTLAWAFALGMLVGCSVVFLMYAGREEIGLAGLVYAPAFHDAATEGWHTINVYYGDQEAFLGPEEKSQPWFSQVHQDEIVVDLLSSDDDRSSSFYFIDLAANDAKVFSNTLALERRGNWKGLCIEPNPAYWYGLSHRQCTVVGAMLGGEGNVEPVAVKFRGVYGGIVGKLDERLANRKKEPDAPTEYRYIQSVKEVFRKFNVPNVIDYMSLDVEGAEYLIMQHFPADEYIVRLVTIERPDENLKAWLESHDYVFLKDLVWWGETLWAHKSTGLTPESPKVAKIKTISNR